MLWKNDGVWHTKALWNLRKRDVVDDETALRLGKLLRDNRHTLMSILQKINDAAHFTFLATFLELSYAERNVQFLNLRVEKHITQFDRINYTFRETKYVEEQKSRRCRVAFESLRDYFTKGNCNACVMSTEMINRKVKSVLNLLQSSSPTIHLIDNQIATILSINSEIPINEGFRVVVSSLPATLPPNFMAAKSELSDVMGLVAVELSNKWKSERYIRGELNFDF